MDLSTQAFSVSEKEFELFKNLIYEKAGIALSDKKRSLLVSRLSKHMRGLGVASLLEYYDLVTSKRNLNELQQTIDLLTTNETYFFREMKHFEFLKEHIIKKIHQPSSFKLWSAACSSGEEPYSIAMVLAEKFGLYSEWRIYATDINSDVINNAKRGLYQIKESEKISAQYLREYCLKGVRQHEGTMLMDKRLKRHIDFERLNLNAEWPNQIRLFDVVFLRNIMIYFDKETKRRLLDKIADKIKIGGYLFIGHSETLGRLSDRFEIIRPAICQKIK